MSDSKTKIRYISGGYNSCVDGHLTRFTETEDQMKREEYLCGPNYRLPSAKIELAPDADNNDHPSVEVCLYCLKIALASIQ